jgi:hypothetical protein
MDTNVGDWDRCIVVESTQCEKRNSLIAGGQMTSSVDGGSHGVFGIVICKDWFFVHSSLQGGKSVDFYLLHYLPHTSRIQRP